VTLLNLFASAPSKTLNYEINARLMLIRVAAARDLCCRSLSRFPSP
jgi:hypothetical protein